MWVCVERKRVGKVEGSKSWAGFRVNQSSFSRQRSGVTGFQIEASTYIIRTSLLDSATRVACCLYSKNNKHLKSCSMISSCCKVVFSDNNKKCIPTELALGSTFYTTSYPKWPWHCLIMYLQVRIHLPIHSSSIYPYVYSWSYWRGSNKV